MCSQNSSGHESFIVKAPLKTVYVEELARVPVSASKQGDWDVLELSDEEEKEAEKTLFHLTFAGMNPEILYMKVVGDQPSFSGMA